MPPCARQWLSSTSHALESFCMGRAGGLGGVVDAEASTGLVWRATGTHCGGLHPKDAYNPCLQIVGPARIGYELFSGASYLVICHQSLPQEGQSRQLSISQGTRLRLAGATNVLGRNKKPDKDLVVPDCVARERAY